MPSLPAAITIAIASLMLFTPLPVVAQQPDVKAAMTLYSQHQYAQAAAAFEPVIQARPDKSTCYYAALANRAAGKELRARQLFNYVVKNYPGTTEAQYAETALSQMHTHMHMAKSEPQGSAALPKSVLDALPPEVRAKLDTEEGKTVLGGILKEQAGNLATVREAEKTGVMPKNVQSFAPVVASAAGLKREHKDGDYVFTAQDIARDGAGGIDQTRFPNCWFEASMSALAELPRGQRLIASMIKYKGDDKYVVRFPGDGVEYVITPKDLAENSIHDKALWASLLDAAEIRKFPDNAGANGAEGDQSRLEIGMKCICGSAAEIRTPSACSVQELSSFIGGAITAHNPIVAATYSATYLANFHPLVIPQHAYTIIGFDATKNMILLRNPHGARSQRFSLPSDPEHLQFQQLDDGKLRMSIPTFQKYFGQVARAAV